MIPIYDPLTTDAAGNRTAFPGNIIPPNRINPWARDSPEGASAADAPSELTTGIGNLPAQDVIKDAAQQGSLKLDHHFSDNVSLSGVYPVPELVEPDRQLLPRRALCVSELPARSRRSTCSC